jgi:hypothetical protein
MAKKNINEMSLLDHLEDLSCFVMKHNSYYCNGNFPK